MRLLGKLLLALFVFFSTTISVFAQNEPRVVKVGIYENAPKVYIDSNGVPAGVFVDILEVIAVKENWKIEYVSGTFDEGLERVRAGEIDIMVDVAAEPEREKIYALTQETVLSSWGVIYVTKNSNINSLIDLDRKTIGILKSSVYYDGPASVKQYAGAFHLHFNFVETAEYDEVFSMLSDGKIDAAVVSRISGLTAEAKYPKIKATDIIFKPTELRFALGRNNPDVEYLISRLDFWVTQLRDGYGDIYRTILEKHNLLGLTPEVKVTPTWVLPFTLLANVGLIVSWIITFTFAYLYKKSLTKIRELEKVRPNKKTKTNR